MCHYPRELGTHFLSQTALCHNETFRYLTPNLTNVCTRSLAGRWLLLLSDYFVNNESADKAILSVFEDKLELSQLFNTSTYRHQCQCIPRAHNSVDGIPHLMPKHNTLKQAFALFFSFWMQKVWEKMKVFLYEYKWFSPKSLPDLKQIANSGFQWIWFTWHRLEL